MSHGGHFNYHIDPLTLPQVTDTNNSSPISHFAQTINLHDQPLVIEGSYFIKNLIHYPDRYLMVETSL